MGQCVRFEFNIVGKAIFEVIRKVYSGQLLHLACTFCLMSEPGDPELSWMFGEEGEVLAVLGKSVNYGKNQSLPSSAGVPF